jgi:hypothetical protein
MEFNYRLQQNPEAVIDRVCQLAQDRLVVSGNSRRGTFTGAFDGSYKVEGDRAQIVIRRKPIFVTWTLIDKGLKHLVA